jgi:2-oxo-3-hexenedioate decarboxylase/2-keto-4-pentenoate hydratase
MPADESRIREAARFLIEAHRGRQIFGPVPATARPRNIDEAYATQEAFQKLSTEMHGAIAGYKIAATTQVMQQMLGLNEPLAGALFARTMYQSPATVRASDYVRLGVECEIAVQLGAGLPAARGAYSREEVGQAVAAVMAAFELVDDRQADYAQLTANVFSVIADNVWNAGIVLGVPVADWRPLDLAAARGTMRINDTIVGEGHGRDVMGHPLEALTWLVNMLAKRGKSLPQGTIITTGSVIPTKFVRPGDRVHLSVDGLGEASLRVE